DPRRAARPRMRIVLLGLSITSSWGNGHATNYRALVKELARRGHDVTFLERDVPWYADNRDLPRPPWGETHLYGSVDELRARRTPCRGLLLLRRPGGLLAARGR